MKNNFGNKETMGKNIRRYLDLRGLTAKDVCDELDIPRATFSNWCTGSTYPRIDKIEKMAHFFGCTKADLVEEPDNNPYYLNSTAKDYAQFLFENPEYRVLFDAARNVKKEDLEKVRAIIDMFKNDGE